MIIYTTLLKNLVKAFPQFGIFKMFYLMRIKAVDYLILIGNSQNELAENSHIDYKNRMKSDLVLLIMTNQAIGIILLTKTLGI